MFAGGGRGPIDIFLIPNSFHIPMIRKKSLKDSFLKVNRFGIIWINVIRHIHICLKSWIHYHNWKTYRAGLEERELLLKSRTSKRSLEVMVETNTWYNVGFTKTNTDRERKLRTFAVSLYSSIRPLRELHIWCSCHTLVNIWKTVTRSGNS